MKQLDALVDRYDLPDGARRKLGLLLRELAQPAASTSVHDPVQAVNVHIADSLAGLEVEQIKSAGTLADLGSGAGLPSLVLAVALPETRVVAIESVAKKVSFMQDTADAMGLENFEAVAVRAEEWQEGLEACDVVTARAVASLPVLLEYAAPLLRIEAVLVAWKGSVDEQERADGAAAAEELGMTEPRPRRVTPFKGSQRRTLYLSSKVRVTPPKYPRRAGMASKKPLRANT